MMRGRGVIGSGLPRVGWGEAVALFTSVFLILVVLRAPWLDGEAQVVERVRRAEGEVWVWGHFLGPVLRGGRTPAYRYFFNLPLLHYPGHETRLRDAIAEAVADPPGLIIDECRVVGTLDPCIDAVDSPELRTLLRGYEPETVGRFTVYTKR